MNIDKRIATRQSYGEKLAELGEKNDNIIVFDADLAGATKTSIFKKAFPNRFFDMGIAEQDMMSTAAGMSTFGKIPYVSTFAMFAAGRAYDQIRNSICYPNLNVKICATHSGITVGEDGATHQMLEDISLMRGLPNMTVISTSDDTQTRWAVEEISKIQGPVYLRLCRLDTPIIYEENEKFEIGKAVQIGEGTVATVFATGVVVQEAMKSCDVGLVYNVLQLLLKDNIPIKDMLSIVDAIDSLTKRNIKDAEIISEHVRSALSRVITDLYKDSNGNEIVDSCVPADVERELERIYDNGITFWMPGKIVGDYTQDNSPVIT